MPAKPRTVFIIGPTATGKTSLADSLAQKFNGELISADSRQVYEGLDIVTGKDIPKSPIHGLDLVKPGEDWNVSLFQEFAQKSIKSILKRKKLPIIVGGTGLYIKSLLEPIETNIPPNQDLRFELEQLSVPELQTKLKKINPKYFSQMNHSDQNNPRRLVRAIEIAEISSPVIPSAAEGSLLKHPKFDTMVIGMNAPLDHLERRIKTRVINRLNQNPRQELEYLKSLTPNWSSSPATSLGYKELDQYYQGNLTKEELINLWTTRERQYVKKQLTWFKKQANIHWFDISAKNYQSDIVDLVSAWYTEHN